MLDFYEPPDPYVPAAEWAVVNVSGQRFHINMKHIKEYHKGIKRTSNLEPSNLEGRFVVKFFELVFDLELVLKIVEISSLKYA